MSSYLQMPNDAEGLFLLQAAGGGGGELVRPTDQQVTCGRVTAPLGADIRKLRELRLDGAPQGCREDNWDEFHPNIMGLLSVMDVEAEQPQPRLVSDSEHSK